MKKVFFNSKDGTKLCGVWHLPFIKTSKAIVFVHGITVDKNESYDGFVKLADFLCENGFACFRFDFRGAGESEGKSVDMTIQGELEDLSSAVDMVASQGYVSTGLLGVSFGGGISTLYAVQNQSKLKCICLCSPVLNYEHCFLHPYLPWIKDKIGQMRVDFEEKGWSELGSRKMRIGEQLFKEMGKVFPYEEIKKIKIPLTIIHGTKDTYVPYEDSKEYINGVGNLVTIKEGGHGLGNNIDEQKQIFDAIKYFFNKNLV